MGIFQMRLAQFKESKYNWSWVRSAKWYDARLVIFRRGFGPSFWHFFYFFKKEPDSNVIQLYPTFIFEPRSEGVKIQHVVWLTSAKNFWSKNLFSGREFQFPRRHCLFLQMKKFYPSFPRSDIKIRRVSPWRCARNERERSNFLSDFRNEQKILYKKSSTILSKSCENLNIF